MEELDELKNHVKNISNEIMEDEDSMVSSKEFEPSLYSQEELDKLSKKLLQVETRGNVLGNLVEELSFLKDRLIEIFGSDDLYEEI